MHKDEVSDYSFGMSVLTNPGPSKQPANQADTGFDNQQVINENSMLSMGGWSDINNQSQVSAATSQGISAHVRNLN